MTRARYVDGSADLHEALKTAQPGTVILLEAGDYGKLSLGLYNEIKADFPGNVTIRSADPDNPAVFSSISLREVQNLSFEDVVFHAKGAETAITVGDSSNIAIRNSLITGDLIEDPSSPLDGLPSSSGMSIRNTDGVILEGNELTNLIYGATIRFSSDITVQDNEFHNLRIDGLRFGAVEDVLIEDNHFHDFVTREGLSDHRDMIQFWTTDTVTPTRNVVIRDNILDSGTGTHTQSIFMRNELVDSGRAGHELFYRDILIENNLIYNAHTHGITVGETEGLRIINNTLLHNPDSGDRGGVSKPSIRTKEASTDVTIKNNIAHSVVEAPEGADRWDVRDNLIVQSDHPAKPNYIGDLFVDALAGGGDATLASLQGIPGGIVDKGGYGASLTRFDKKPDGLTALIRPDGESAEGFTFDAGFSANSTGFITEKDASFVWDMGDGTILEGLRVQHSFAPGDYRVTLTVTDRDGNVDTISTKVYMPEPLRLALTATSEGLIDASSFGAVLPDDVEIVQDGERFGARIGSDSGFSLARNAAPIHDLDAFTISFNLKALNGAESGGEVFRLHSSMLMNVASDGRFSFDITNADGEKFRLRSDPTEINNGDWHNVSLTYDKAHGSLLLYLDGTEIAEIEMSGSTKPLESWGLSFGAWNKVGFDGLIDGFEVHSEEMSSAEIKERYGIVVPGEPTEPPVEGEPPVLEEEPATESPVRLAIDMTADGLVDHSSFGAVLPDDVEIVQDGERFGARIGSDSGFKLARNAAPIHDLDAFTISFNLKALNGAESGGEVFRLHSSMLLNVTSGGRFSFDITNADGEKFKLRSDPTEVTDGDWHNVSLTYDKAHGTLLLYLDGTEVAEIEMSGSTKPLEYWGLSFGAWNKVGFDGLIDGFEVHAEEMSSAEIKERYGIVGPNEPTEPPVEGEPPVLEEEPATESPVRLAIDMTADGLVDHSSFGAVLPDDVEIVQDGEGFGARIGSDTGFRLKRGAAPIHDLDAFTISFNLKALNGAESGGEVFRLHSSMLMNVASDGRFSFDITNAEGEKFKLRSDPTEVTDGAWHNVSLTYDKAHGALLLYLDGTEIAEIEMSGSTKPLEYWGLSFGAWNKIGFDGLIDGFEVRDEALSSAEISDRYTGSSIVPDEPAIEPPNEKEPPITEGPPTDGSPEYAAPDEDGPDMPAPALPEWAEAIWKSLIFGEMPKDLPTNPWPENLSWLDNDHSTIIDLLAEELTELWQRVQSLLDQKRDELRLAGKEEAALSAAGDRETSDPKPEQNIDLWSDLALLLDSEGDILRFRDSDDVFAEWDDADLLPVIASSQGERGETSDLLVADTDLLL